MSRVKLSFKALVVLWAVVDAARKGPVQGTPGIRLALAFLYATAKRPDRGMYDEFYTAMQKDHAKAHSDIIGNTLRSNDMTRLMHGICRNAGVELTAELMHKLYSARLGKDEREAFEFRSYYSNPRKLLLQDLRTAEEKAADAALISDG